MSEEECIAIKPTNMLRKSSKRKSLFNEDLSIEGEKEFYPPGYEDLITYETKMLNNIVTDTTQKKKQLQKELENDININVEKSVLPNAKQKFVKKNEIMSELIEILQEKFNEIKILKQKEEVLMNKVNGLEEYLDKKIEEEKKDIAAMYPELMPAE